MTKFAALVEAIDAMPRGELRSKATNLLDDLQQDEPRLDCDPFEEVALRFIANVQDDAALAAIVKGI